MSDMFDLSTEDAGGQGSQALAEAIFDAAVDSIMIIDERGILCAANRSAQREFGYSKEELLGNNIKMLMPDPYAREHDGYLANYHNSGERKIIGIGREVIGLRKDGSTFPLHLSVNEFTSNGRLLFVGICHDISERRKSAEHIAYLAAYDSLTNCMNRRQLLAALGPALESCHEHQRHLAVLFIDLDGFKQVNDNNGHQVGDRLLKRVAELFRKSLRDCDILGRVGGDEFVVVAPLDRESSREVAEILARRLIDALRTPVILDGLSLPVGASIGISLFPEHGQNADELVNEADLAMYQAKLNGGSGFHFFSQELRDRAEQTYRLLGRLRQAITLGQFELHYQPLFDMRTLKVAGLEALLRWRDGRGQLIDPGSFIPLAHEHGLMAQIDRWVISRACHDNARLIEDGLLDVPVAVNVCAPLFGENDFAGLVRDSLHGSNLKAHRLELEITEDVAMSVTSTVLENAQLLVSEGVDLVMDDFGVGFSSLARLKMLQFSELKIDRSFVNELPGSPGDQAIIRATVGIARGLGLRTVAEGIENEQQLLFLREAGCDVGQGFWFARPMPLEQLRVWLQCSDGAQQVQQGVGLAGAVES